MTSGEPQVLPASVIIPSRNRPGLLLDCVRSILDGDTVPKEIVVVDQSAEENAEIAAMGAVHGCDVRYRRLPSAGVSAARNEACSVAGGDTLVFTDDDMIVAPGWLFAVVAAVRADPERTLITGRVLPADDAESDGFAPSLIEDREPRTYEGRVWSDVLFSNNMAFSRTVYDRLGPFDVRLGVGSPYRAATDNDYCFRALEAGCRIRYVPEAVAYHRAWRSKKRLTQLQWDYGFGQGACLMKHARLDDRYTLIRLRNGIVRHLRAAVAERGRGREHALGEAAYGLGLLYGAGRWLVLERLLGR